ncbi:MAG: aldehyde dehydrogenase family protein, partial [Myxococcales bacterium]|nr:aldehyde dehydrogenase family protein [Myxococcales bacterium]
RRGAGGGGASGLLTPARIRGTPPDMSNGKSDAWQRFEVLGNYIDGRFTIPPSPSGAIRSTNPGDPEDVIGEFPWHADTIDEAVGAARRAFSGWSRTPFEERAACLRRYAEAARANESRLAECISREMGKVLWEARGEAKAIAAKVEITLDEGMALVADHRPEGVQGFVRYLPRGVMAVIGPFNFPAHLPNGHIIPALATGNTVVLKAASANPGVGQILAECAHAAGFPPGVFNFVQVPGRHSDRLVAHPDVDGVLFTGSTEVGQHIQRITLEQPWKITALEMGGKNPAIVLDDAPLELALYEVLTGAYLTSGQRCTATSRILCQRGIADEFAARLARATEALVVGEQRDPGAFMGPLVSRKAAEEFEAWQGIAAEEGAEALVRGGLWTQGAPREDAAYVRPSLHRISKVDAESRYQKSELFAPDTCLYTIDSLEEAIALADDTEYGLACSIFTQRREAYMETLRGVRAGVINWNRATVGANSKLPFGGMKASGNGHPAALFSVFYCTYPVASLEHDKPFDPSAVLPGITL